MTNEVQIKSYDIKDNFLIVTFKDQVETVSNKLRLLLKERELKVTSQFEVDVIEWEGSYGFKLDLSNIEFASESKSIIDIYVSINEEKPANLVKNVPEVKDRSIRYLPSAYHISYRRIAIPYLTLKNSLSIIYGSKAQVYKSHCTFIDDKITINNLSVENNQLLLSTNQIAFDEVDDVYFVIRKRKSKSDSKIIKHELINSNTVVLDVKDRNWNLKQRYDLYVNVKVGRIIQTLRVGTAGKQDEDNQFDIITFDNDLIVSPYITTKGEISFVVLNNWLYEYESSTKSIQYIYFDSTIVNNNYLTINLSDNISNDISHFSRWKLVVKSTNNSTSFQIEPRNYKLSSECLEINVKEAFENIGIRDGKWDFYVKSYNDVDSKVEIFKFKKQSVWVESSIKRFSRPIIINEDNMIVSYVSPNNELGVMLGDQYLYPKNAYTKVNSLINIGDIKIQENQILFKIKEFDVQDIEMARILIKSRDGKSSWVIEVERNDILQQGYITLDLSEFVDLYQYSKSRWDFHMEIVHNNTIHTGKIGCYDEELLPKHKRYFLPMAIRGNIAFVPYLSIYNELSLVVNDTTAISNEMVPSKVSLTDFNMEKSVITGTAEVEVKEINVFDINSVILKYRGKADENIEYEFPVTNKETKESRLTVSFEMDLSSIDFQPFYWDVYVVIVLEDKTYPVKIKNPAKEVKEAIDNKIVEYSYTFEDGYFVYPYISAANTLALTYREKPYYESLSYKIKEKLAFHTYNLFRKYFDKRDIWLAYEKFSEGAQDNGYYFFKYCYENNKKKDFYYIIKKDSPDYENVHGMKDKVVEFMSFRYMLLMYAANLLISSESKGHVYDIRIQKGKLKEALNKKKHVFLQHGVTALKRVDYVFKKTKENAVDLFVATSDYEKEIIKKYFGYNDDEVITTGFCRWDVLEDKSGEEKEIFVMPTWRTWMDDLPEEKFLETDYYKNYVGFFQSERLKEILTRNNVKLSFYIHPKFKSYIDNFNVENQNIKIYQYGEEKVNTLLMKSSMLITDYSSVAWEMFYQKKPVVFFQFDLDKYNAFQGSYLDMEKELFGDQVFTVDNLVNSVNEYIERDFAEKEQFGSMRSKYFKYVDQKNCERTYKAIMKNKGKLKKKK